MKILILFIFLLLLLLLFSSSFSLSCITQNYSVYANIIQTTTLLIEINTRLKTSKNDIATCFELHVSYMYNVLLASYGTSKVSPRLVAFLLEHLFGFSHNNSWCGTYSQATPGVLNVFITVCEWVCYELTVCGYSVLLGDKYKSVLSPVSEVNTVSSSHLNILRSVWKSLVASYGLCLMFECNLATSNKHVHLQCDINFEGE